MNLIRYWPLFSVVSLPLATSRLTFLLLACDALSFTCSCVIILKGTYPTPDGGGFRLAANGNRLRQHFLRRLTILETKPANPLHMRIAATLTTQFNTRNSEFAGTRRRKACWADSIKCSLGRSATCLLAFCFHISTSCWKRAAFSRCAARKAGRTFAKPGSKQK